MVRLDPGAGPGQWKTIVPSASYALVGEAPVVSGDRVYALAIDGGPTRLLAYDLSGRPVPVQQLVVQGLVSRGGGNFAWLLKKMG